MSNYHVALKHGADVDGFRLAVRRLVAQKIEPMQVSFSADDAPGLFGSLVRNEGVPIILPKAVSQTIETVVCHRDADRYGLLYQLIWRSLHGERDILEMQSDPLIFRLWRMAKEIRRDLHKMHAFVRFRRTCEETGAERYVAWFEPGNFILESAASFFVERFRGMKWSILTPIGALHWDGSVLTYGPAARREDAPQGDALQPVWSGYFESTFNPARVNPDLMRQHMPKKYWRNLPETASIPLLVRAAQSRVSTMLEQDFRMSAKRNPDKAVGQMQKQAPQTLDALNRIITQANPFVPGATRAVLGEGPIYAPIAFVGEQPGDQEDIEGHPFVGPAGQLLNRALQEAGIERDKSYITNAVKHFKFSQRGKRRIHEKPTAGEVRHYRWWLEKELEFVEPRIVVALGATAALALSGKALAVGKNRGPIHFGSRKGFITVHPSYLLRLPDQAARAQAYRDFVADLQNVRTLAQRGDNS